MSKPTKPKTAKSQATESPAADTKFAIPNSAESTSIGRKPAGSKSDVRRRILETADRLFYAESIRGVGIDRIIAEAGVAKMSLYKHFASKDELILEVLRYREQLVMSFLQSAVARHEKKSENKLFAFFAGLKDLLESDDFRGCPFQNAVTELADPNHPGTTFVREHKRRFFQLLRQYVIDSVGAKGAKVAPMISLLVEGATITATIHGDSSSATIARNAAIALLKTVEND